MKVCPDKFILVPENLFDLIYNNIKKENYPKEDYKMKALIGDGLLFLQGKQNSCQFPIFRHNGKKFKLYYYLSLDEQSSFFDEVNKFIKGFGLFNYIIERNLDIEPKEKINDLKNNKKQSIGKYINIRKIEKDEINEFKFRTKIYNLKNIAYSLNAFTDNLWNMEENNFNLKDINNICKKIKNEEISYIKVGIILNNDLTTLKEKIFYNDINDLIRYEGKQEYEKKEKKIIKKLTERDEDDIRTFGENLLIYNPKNLDKDKEKNYDYNFINFNIKSLLSESEDDEDLPESYYFANKGEYFIIFPSKKKVYKIDHDKEQDNFKLEEINNEDLKKNGEKKIDFKIFAKNINDLDKNEKDIISKIKLNFKNIFSMEKYYLVSSKWIKIFKDQFKGSKNIKIEQLDDYLLNEDNLRPNNIQNDINYDKETPNDFVIIMESLFKEILDNMNSLKKNLKLHSEYLYEVSFGDELIFIKELKTNDIFIYSFDEEEEKYKIKYILFLEKNQDIKELLKACKDFKEFLNNYNLNLTTQKIQIIETLKKINKKKKQKINIGTFKCIQIEEPEPEKPSHCLGLENIGATCYMNATIQCLCHVSKFKNYFLDGNLINNVTQDKNCPLTKEFASLVNHLWTLPKNNNNKSYYTPTSFKNIISQMNPLFEGIAANDSKDLILFIYENIHREINSIPYNFIQYNLNNCNNDIELVNFRNTYYPANSSILVDTFYFEQQSFLQCYSCNCIKISYSVVNMLIFPLEKVRQYVYQASNGQRNDVDIDLCFKHNQLGENLTGQNQIYCNQCGRTSDAITTNFIYTSPEALTIILNRGQGLEFNVNFKLDYYINIDNYVRIKTPGKSNMYELIGILCHFGPSGMSGHFIAFCKSPEDKNWYCYNDATVTKCEGDPNISTYGNVDGIPYVLFYQRYEDNQEKIENSMKEAMKNFSQSYNQNVINANNNINNSINNNNNNIIYNPIYDNNNNNSYNNNVNNILYNNYIQTDNVDNVNNKSSTKNQKKKINLIFQYEGKEYYLEIKKKATVKEVIIQLNEKYKIPLNVMVLLEKNNNMTTLEIQKTINEYNLSNNDVLAIVGL